MPKRKIAPETFSFWGFSVIEMKKATKTGNEEIHEIPHVTI